MANGYSVNSTVASIDATTENVMLLVVYFWKRTA